LEDVQPGREVGTPVTEFPSDHYLRRSSEVWGTGEETHDSLHDIRDAVSSPSAVSDSPSLLELSIANDVPGNPWADSHSTPIDHPNSSPTVPTLYIAPSEAFTGQSVRQIEGEESDELAPQKRSDTYVGSPAIPVDLQSVERREPAQTAKKHKPLKINEAKRLMNLAHEPGNVAVLGKVQQLLRVARETTKEERTPGQKHLLAEWRSVEWDIGNYPPRKPRPPKGAKTPVADASAEDWAAYYATLSVKGLRRDSEGKPILSDVKALRTVARLRPVKSDNNKTPDNKIPDQFKPAVAQFFSVHDAYKNLLRNENIPIAPSVTYTPYSGSYDANNIARHFAECGITYAVANTELGPWAEEYLKSHCNTSEVQA
jgi:hypothetical protein